MSAAPAFSCNRVGKGRSLFCYNNNPFVDEPANLQAKSMITFSQTFRIYEMLNKYFQNEEDARALASGIEEMVNQRFQSEKERLATKMDMMELKGDIMQLKVRMRQGFRQQLKLIGALLGGFGLLMVVIARLISG